MRAASTKRDKTQVRCFGLVKYLVPLATLRYRLVNRNSHERFLAVTIPKPPADSVAAKAAKPKRKAKAEGAAEMPAAGNDLKKPELVDIVVEKAGLKKKDVKPAVDAILAALGEAIAAGRSMTLPPLGKLRVTRSEDKPNGSVAILKLRRGGGGGKDNDPLAETEE